jgi:hypothetical protein
MKQVVISAALVGSLVGCVDIADSELEVELDEQEQAVSALAHTSCTVDYRVANQWATGFQGDVKITNTGAAGKSWQVKFRFRDGQVVSQAWNAQVSQSGANVTANSTSWNGALATGSSASFGFFASHSGTNRTPTAITCTINT